MTEEDGFHQIRVSVEGFDRKAQSFLIMSDVEVKQVWSLRSALDIQLSHRLEEVLSRWIGEVTTREIPEPKPLFGHEKLDWAGLWGRCRAVREPNPSGHWGRCELKKDHEDDHALERGMDIPRWSTKWTR